MQSLRWKRIITRHTPTFPCDGFSTSERVLLFLLYIIQKSAVHNNRSLRKLKLCNHRNWIFKIVCFVDIYYKENLFYLFVKYTFLGIFRRIFSACSDWLIGIHVCMICKETRDYFDVCAFKCFCDNTTCFDGAIRTC